MKDWYEEKIEEPLRDLVKILRNNGVNTTCSCGHEMYIQCAFSPGYDDPMKIGLLVSNYLLENKIICTYDITFRIRHRNISPSHYISIDFIDLEGNSVSPHKSQKFAINKNSSF